MNGKCFLWTWLIIAVLWALASVLFFSDIHWALGIPIGFVFGLIFGAITYKPKKPSGPKG